MYRLFLAVPILLGGIGTTSISKECPTCIFIPQERIIPERIIASKSFIARVPVREIQPVRKLIKAQPIRSIFENQPVRNILREGIQRRADRRADRRARRQDRRGR